MICNDTILFSLIKLKGRKGNTAANSLDDKGIREQYRSRLSRSIYLTKKKPPVSIHVDEREKIYFIVSDHYLSPIL